MWTPRTTRTPLRPNLIRARRTVAVVAALILALVPGPVRAADGDLDPTFGDAGKVKTTYPGGAAANAVAVQPDGGIVIAGCVDDTFAVARYLPGGTLDPDFGVDGLVTTPIGVPDDAANAVSLLPDGRIVVAGTDDGERFAVLRYLADGTLDPSFGGHGIVRTPRAAHFRGGEDLAIQPNGTIVVVGTAGESRVKTAFAVARFRPNGTEDRSFGGDGRVVTPFASGQARAVALQPDGRIVVAGYNSFGLALARYLPNGALDRTFGGDGKVGHWAPSSPPSAMYALAVAIQPDGRILAAGGYDFFLMGIARFLPHGRLDPSFGGDGVVRTDVKGAEQALNALALQPDGRILAAGSSWPHESITEGVPRFVVIRYLRDGSLDPSWGGDGKVVTFFPGRAYAAGAALQPDGKLVVVGEIGLYGGEGFALARYLT
jgi:uncharacterized delta-60 repeat protein